MDGNIPSPSKETREKVPVNPLVPFWISGRIRLLVFRLENTHDLAIRISREVASRAPLGDHTGVHALIDGDPDAVHYLVELCLGHGWPRHHGECLGSGGSNARGRVENTVVYLGALLVAELAPLGPLELGCYLISPSLEPCVYGFQVNARVAPMPSREMLLLGKGFGRGHARVRPRLRIGRKARRGLGLEGGRALSQKLVVIVGLVAEPVSLG